MGFSKLQVCVVQVLVTTRLSTPEEPKIFVILGLNIALEFHLSRGSSVFLLSVLPLIFFFWNGGSRGVFQCVEKHVAVKGCWRQGWRAAGEDCLNDRDARKGGVLGRLDGVQICGKKQKVWDSFSLIW